MLLRLRLLLADSLQTQLGHCYVLQSLDEEVVFAGLDVESEDHQNHRGAGGDAHRGVRVGVLMINSGVVKERLHGLKAQLQLGQNNLLFVVVEPAFLRNFGQNLHELLHLVDQLIHLMRHRI